MRRATAGCEKKVSFNMPAKATIKRQLLAWYIDFLFASVLAFFLTYFLQAQSWLSGYGFYIPAVLLVVLGRIAPKFSIGQEFLSIDANGFVDSGLVERGSFWLMFLATVLVLDGTKQLVRWADFSSWPVLGQQPQGIYQVAIAALLGSLSICAGYWVFKLDRRGFWLTLALLTFWMLSILMSWSLMNELIAQRTTERRALQGLPVRAGEIEFMQLVTTPGLLGVGLILFALLFWQRSRFAKK
jgi:hypothetical protein